MEQNNIQVNYLNIFNDLYNNTKDDDILYSRYLFEIIDNRHHSKSKKVFINIDREKKICIFGYENPVETKSKFDKFNILRRREEEHYKNDNISSRGMGLHYHNSFLRSNTRYISYINDDKIFESSFNYNNIFDEIIKLDENSVNFEEFEIVLKKGGGDYGKKTVSFCSSSTEEHLDNIRPLNKTDLTNNSYPFKPKTLICCDYNINYNAFNKNVCIGNIKRYWESVIEELKKKYYYDIVNNKLELYIKTPINQEGFINLNEDKHKLEEDIIGYNNFKNNNIDIYIKGFTIVEVKYKQPNKTKDGCYIGILNDYRKELYIIKSNGGNVFFETHKFNLPELNINLLKEKNIREKGIKICLSHTQNKRLSEKKEHEYDVEDIKLLVNIDCFINPITKDYKNSDGMYYKCGDTLTNAVADNNYPFNTKVKHSRTLIDYIKNTGFLSEKNLKSETSVDKRLSSDDKKNTKEDKFINSFNKVINKYYIKAYTYEGEMRKNYIKNMNDFSTDYFFKLWQDLNEGSSNKKSDEGHIYLIKHGINKMNNNILFKYGKTQNYTKRIKEHNTNKNIDSLKKEYLDYKINNNITTLFFKKFNNISYMEQFIATYINNNSSFNTKESKSSTTIREYFSTNINEFNKLIDILDDNNKIKEYNNNNNYLT